MMLMCWTLRDPLLESVFLFIPLRWRVAARAVCPRLRRKLDAQTACLLGLLRPSTLSSNLPCKPIGSTMGFANVALRPVLELEAEFQLDPDVKDRSSITCMCFGQQQLHKFHVVLAVASRSGQAVVYRCRRNDMELALLSNLDFTLNNDASTAYPCADCNQTGLTLQARLSGHSRAITSMYFCGVLEDRLITASIDKTVRFWDVDCGALLQVYIARAPVCHAICLPLNPEIFVIANAQGMLHLCRYGGLLLQTLKYEAQRETRALAFDDTGHILFAGARSGIVRVFATTGDTLHALFEVSVGLCAVHCITFVPAGNGSPARLILNATTDSTIKILDCLYEAESKNRIKDIVVARSLEVQNKLLPLKSCYSSSGGGYVVSGSEDHAICLYSMAGGCNHQVQRLQHHTAPVIAVAINNDDTLLVSGDALGRLVLWRRMCV